MQIAIPLFPEGHSPGRIAPYEVLQRVPQLDIAFVGHARGEVRTDNDLLGLTVDKTVENSPTIIAHTAP
jgi:hypothetical protein